VIEKQNERNMERERKKERPLGPTDVHVDPSEFRNTETCHMERPLRCAPTTVAGCCSLVCSPKRTSTVQVGLSEFRKYRSFINKLKKNKKKYSNGLRVNRSCAHLKEQRKVGP